MSNLLHKPDHYERHDQIDRPPLAEALCQISFSPIKKSETIFRIVSHCYKW